MSATSDQEIDRLILLVAKDQWRKVAMIISQVLRASEHEADNTSLDVLADAIADRVQHLAVEGKLQSQGDLSRWRHSEVRLPE